MNKSSDKSNKQMKASQDKKDDKKSNKPKQEVMPKVSYREQLAKRIDDDDDDYEECHPNLTNTDSDGEMTDKNESADFGYFDSLAFSSMPTYDSDYTPAKYSSEPDDDLVFSEYGKYDYDSDGPSQIKPMTNKKTK